MVLTSNIPIELKNLPSWVGHQNKVPMNPHTYLAASSGDKATWGTYREALDAAEANGWDGVGFMFGAPFVGIDLDHCVENGIVNEFARGIIEVCNSYTEFSPSGTGIHIICKGAIPKAMKAHKTDSAGNAYDHIEVYNAGRYFTVTGNVIRPYSVLRTTDLSFLFKEKDVIKAVEQNSDESWMLAQLEAIKPGAAGTGRTPTFVRVIGRLKAKGLLIDEAEAFLKPWVDKFSYGSDRLKALVADQYRRYSPPLQTVGGGAETLEQFFAQTEAVEWLCEPFIARRTLGFLVGLPETKKTWVLMDLAIELARGEGNWLGRFPVKQAKVLFVDQERFKGETQRRFRALIAGKGLTIQDLSGSLTIQCGTTTRIDLQHSYDAFRKRIDETRPDVVMVDSWATFHTKEENNRGEVQEVFERLKQLRNDFGCTFVFIDHENKGAFHDKELDQEPSALRMSGSIGKLAAAEFAITVRKQDAEASFVYHTKSTLASCAAPFLIKVEDVEPGKIKVVAY